MNIFKLNKVTNRIVIIVLIVISLTIISLTIVFASILINLNLSKEIKTLSNQNLDLYYKTNYVIKSLQSRLETVAKQKQFNYIRYKKGLISKNIFLENIKTNLLLTTPSIDIGYGIGFWFEPYVIDSNRYYGYYCIKNCDSSYITMDYNTAEYDYHNKYWYTSIIPKGWDRKLPLNEKFYWSDIYLDSGYSNKKMITLGKAIYDIDNTIVGNVSLDLTEFDFNDLFSEFKDNSEMTIVLRKKHSKNNIYSNNTEFCQTNEDIFNQIIASKQNNSKYHIEVENNGDKYIAFLSDIQGQFYLFLIIPSQYINGNLFTQIYVIAGFAILIISLIIFGFVYSYKVIIDHSLKNESLNNFYQKLIELSPNNMLIFDKEGKLIEYNNRFKKFLKDNNNNSNDLEYFIRSFIGINDNFDFARIDCQELNNYKFYSKHAESHYILNCFLIENEKEKSFVFILTDISELILREMEIKNLNKNLEKIIANRTEQLEGAMSSLQSLNKKLSKNMENLTKVNNDLSFSEKQLKNTIETKDKFFSVITHDIKNPLHSIKMIVELLRNYFKMMKEDEIQSYYGKITKTIDSVNSLIENVLLWSNSQSNLINFEPEIFDLSQSINSTVRLLDSALSQKNISIIKNNVYETIVKTDKNMFEVILRNLLSNAIKFSNKNSQIELTIEDDLIANKLLISINDYGIGMDQNTLSNIFVNKNRNIKSGTDGEKGTGIGLVLTKNFIDLMKEEIWVESSPNMGSKFSFTINKLL